MADLPNANLEQFEKFKKIARTENDTSVFMLNLNRYTVEAKFPDGDLYV